jgi:hypothetical protein
MMSNAERPQARPRFRRLAAVLAALCFLVAALFVGLVMTRVAATGQWPPRRL